MWDRELALSITGGDATLARQMLEMLCDQLPGSLDQLAHLFQKTDWTGLREAAHKLRGSTMYCGVPALDHAVGRLEQAVREHEPTSIETALRRLGEEAARLCGSQDRAIFETAEQAHPQKTGVTPVEQ